MKNIHLIRARESRLYYTISMSGYNLKLSEIRYHQSSEIRPQNIYITSDEEIKEGDYMYDIDGDVGKAIGSDMKEFEGNKKIILTTDQDIIKDGVQAIDDEFLEWFVKNPSCEEVEIETEDYSQKCAECGETVKRGYSCKKGCFMKSGNFISTNKNTKYKIIIPSEENSREAKERAKNYMSLKGALEPKDVVLGYKTSLDAQMLDKVETKQETLEQAAEQSFKTHHIGQQDLAQDVYEDGFVNGAKFMQERMYSEKDMINFAFDTYCYISILMGVEFNKISENKLHAMYNFEQFKKK